MGKRADDLQLVEEVLDCDLTPKERTALEDIQEAMGESQTRCLSEKQRDWLERLQEKRVPRYLNLYSSGKIPEGEAVPLPPVLQNLPKYPPGRAPKNPQ